MSVHTQAQMKIVQGQFNSFVLGLWERESKPLGATLAVPVLRLQEIPDAPRTRPINNIAQRDKKASTKPHNCDRYQSMKSAIRSRWPELSTEAWESSFAAGRLIIASLSWKEILWFSIWLSNRSAKVKCAVCACMPQRRWSTIAISDQKSLTSAIMISDRRLPSDHFGVFGWWFKWFAWRCGNAESV